MLTEGKYFNLSLVVVSFVFLVSRLPYFALYPVVVVSSDSASYIAAAISMFEGKLPLFDIRTPGYPVFIYAIWSMYREFVSIALVQSIFTYLSSVLFLVIAYKYYGKRVIYFALAVCGFISSSYYIILESAILTEGLFTGLMLVTAGALILAVKSGRAGAWSAVSLLFALMIYVRPAGLFLIALFLPIVVYMFITGAARSNYVALFAPFSVLIFALCSYNYQTLGKFTITPFGEANLAGVTILYMEPSAEYPEFVNSAIKTTLDSIPNSDKNAVRKSYNPDRLFNAFKDHYHMQMMLVDNLRRQDSTMTYIKAQPYLRQISIDAIKKNPGSYARFFACNLYYFVSNIRRELDYFGELGKIYKRTYIDNRFIKELSDGKWRQVSGDAEINNRVKELFAAEFANSGRLENIILNDDGSVTLSKNILFYMAEGYQWLVNFLFRNIFWIILFAVMCYYALRTLVKTRFSSADAFIAFLFVSVFVLKALLVSSVESSLERYSYTVEFAVYMSLPFVIILKENLKNLNLNNIK